jgi:CPA2 family monovalent cation:H+ antiporter-2
VLFFGTVTAVTARALRISPIVGYIILGIAARTLGFNAFDSAMIDTLSQLGVVFLLFDIGLQFSWNMVRDRAADIFAFGPIQILACTLLIGSIGVLAGGSPWPMYLMGAILSLSSTAVVTRLIAERHQQNCPVGLTATAILVFQDVAGIILMVIIGSLAQPGSASVGILTALGKAVIAVGVTALAAKYIVGPLFTLVAKTRNEEVSTAAALFIALAGSWAAAQIGLSLTLGGFLGGMSLANTPYRVAIHSEVAAFRGLLLGFFFIAVGYSLDADFLLRSWPLVLLAALGLLVLKTAANIMASLLFRWSVPGSMQLGLLLAQGSEFGLILLSVSQVRTLLGEAFASVLMSAIAVTLALTPAAAQLGRVLAGRMRRRTSPRIVRELTPAKETAPVFIVGMGEVGRTVADALRTFDIGYLAVERDTVRLQAAIADGYEVEHGDTSDTRQWEFAELAHRAVSVVTSLDLKYLNATTKVMVARFPGLHRIVIVPNEESARIVRELGLNVVVDDTEPRGLNAASAVLEKIGRSDSEVAAWRQRFSAARKTFAALASAQPVLEPSG